MTRVRVVIPSLLGDTGRLASMCDAASRVGASPIVVANSRRLCEDLESAGVPYVTSGHNGGFGASVLLGAAGAWDWLVILNDDLEFEPDELAACLAPDSLDAYGPSTIIHLDNESTRCLPGPLGVLLSMSLISNVARHVPFRRRDPGLATPDSFRSFSAVAIGREAWDRVGGIDPRYPFAYEDADFVRRARPHGITVAAMPTTITHRHSQTGGRFITAVLPVSSWSALEYLTKWFGRRALYRWLLVLALLIRAPIAAVALAHPRRQLRAVTAAAKALIVDRQPTLPEWNAV